MIIFPGKLLRIGAGRGMDDKLIAPKGIRLNLLYAIRNHDPREISATVKSA